ncbi:unnamed protein product [Trichogramma brassicae]|uniref:Laminin N-terminal domain-containing protein n=1 Tax=Trichogramma brassicae TaxID=86971 RepID=A0A6H5IC17_9HYME|nr:unnamed protein product [Trichogramma brassicae]
MYKQLEQFYSTKTRMNRENEKGLLEISVLQEMKSGDKKDSKSAGHLVLTLMRLRCSLQSMHEHETLKGHKYIKMSMVDADRVTHFLMNTFLDEAKKSPTDTSSSVQRSATRTAINGNAIPNTNLGRLRDLPLHVSTNKASFSESCELGPCRPRSGDLLIGREHQLSATSTCGSRFLPERYCSFKSRGDQDDDCSHVCDTCDSDVNHTIRNVVNYKDGEIVISRNIACKRRRNKDLWWQSENGVEEVSITLELESHFEMSQLFMRFASPRPAAMLIEKSDNFGRSWRVYQYFARNCSQSFPGIPTGPRKSLADVICLSKYSSLEPISNGEVIYRFV